MEPLPVPSRRRFINWFLGTSFGALIASVIYRSPDPQSAAHPEPKHAQVEAGLTNDPECLDKGFKIIRSARSGDRHQMAEKDIRAFSATCTHRDCIVGSRNRRTPVVQLSRRCIRRERPAMWTASSPSAHAASR